MTCLTLFWSVYQIKLDSMEEHIPPELEELLQTNVKTGLSTQEVLQRVEVFGLNEIKEIRESKFKKFLKYFLGPISFLIEAACVIAGVLEIWTEFGILLGLLILNALVGFLEESKAENALDALKNNLASLTRVWRNQKLLELRTRELVPGDVIVLRLGDIVPADCRLLGIGVLGEQVDGDLLIDQAALTGESLPVSRGKNSIVYSSAIVKQGQSMAVVVKTGPNTFIGRAANLIQITNEQGQFQKIISMVGNYLIYLSCFFVAVILLIRILVYQDTFLKALREVIVLLIAAIPVGLPTVMSTTMALGAKQLAQKQMVVKRLSAVEEFASVRILCSDKTGTLTLNELKFDKPFLCEGNTEQDLLLCAYFASETGAKDAIELAVREAAEQNKELIQNFNETKLLKFLPFNPVVKYTEALVLNLKTMVETSYLKGAPHVVISICGGNKQAEQKVIEFAECGLRALGVAKKTKDKYELVGLISLLDPPRPDSADTIRECRKLGVMVKMITGDQIIIAKEVAKRLNMDRCILDAEKLTDPKLNEFQLMKQVEKADGFGQVIPEHKYRVVELLQKKGYLVGMTGDGVNDAPALKKANVGIAVHGCTDAARSAADMVLLAPGLSTIVDGIKCSRAIFQRMRSYAIYRITSTLHFLFFFFFAIIFLDFTLPHLLILLIAILNDLATLVIAVDNVLISKHPDKWRIGQLLCLSTILAVFLTLFSLTHYFVAKQFNLTFGQIQTVLYLQISSCPHFVIFSTRVGTFLWKSIPGPLFLVAILGTQVFAMFMSIFGWQAMGAEAIGWSWGLGVMFVSLLCMFFLDLIKVFVFQVWSFELTAKLWPSKHRKNVLHQKTLQRQESKRAQKNWLSVREAVVKMNVVSAMIKSEPFIE